MTANITHGLRLIKTFLTGMYYLRTPVAGIDVCKLGPCACSILFTHIRCKHRCLQTQTMCLQLTIYAHLLQASMLANSAHVPAPSYFRTAVASTDACKLALDMTSSLVIANSKTTLIYKEGPLRDSRTSLCNAL